jgi:outer membrane protein assembly factor BamB
MTCGWLTTVWKYDANPPEYQVPRMASRSGIRRRMAPARSIRRRTFYKDRVYVAIGQDPEHGEGVGHLVCVDARQKGDVTQTATIWEYKGIHRSISTVSIDPETDLLFVGDFSGFVHCLDAETGELYWTHDMKAHMWGSTLVADGKVYVGDEDGDFVILAASREKQVLSEAYLNAPVYGTPVVANGVLYLQSNSHLFAFEVPELARPGRPAQLPLPPKPARHEPSHGY